VLGGWGDADRRLRGGEHNVAASKSDGRAALRAAGLIGQIACDRRILGQPRLLCLLLEQGSTSEWNALLVESRWRLRTPQHASSAQSAPQARARGGVLGYSAFSTTRYTFAMAIASPGRLWPLPQPIRVWAEAGTLVAFGLMVVALFLPFAGPDCPGGCTSPALAPVSLVGGADDLWLILSVVLAFGTGSLVQILAIRRHWVATVNLALSLTAVALAIFEGVEAGTRVMHVELINLFNPTALWAGYFVFLGGAVLAAGCTGVLFLLPRGGSRARTEERWGRREEVEGST